MFAPGEMSRYQYRNWLLMWGSSDRELLYFHLNYADNWDELTDGRDIVKA